MSLLEETYQQHRNRGITSSGYARLLGGEGDDIAFLIRAAHAATISNGNELENLIFDFCPSKNKFKNCVHDDKFMSDADAFVVKYKIKKQNFPTGKGADIDMVVFRKDKILVCELKDGENFDTKKSAGEVDKLDASCNFFRKHDLLKRQVEARIILWNCRDLSKSSFKDKRGQAMLTTGFDFAKLVSVDYASLNAQRELAGKENARFIKQKMKEILASEAII